MLSFQRDMKAQERYLCGEILCRVLGLAEKYALGKNKIYNYYNMSSAYGEELLPSLIMQIELLRLSSKKIIFPKSQVLEEINNWEKLVPLKSKKYYKNLSEIISGNDNHCLSLNYEIKQLNQNKQKTKIHDLIMKKKFFPLVDTFINFEDYKNYFIDLHENCPNFLMKTIQI